MATSTITIQGGNRLKAHLAAIAAKLSSGGAVKVGFFRESTYPAKPGAPALPVAQVAAWNEFGTSRSPPRPFFRGMIARKSPEWGAQMAAVAKGVNYDSGETLSLMGEGIKDQLVQSINDFQDPALAPSTVARKGFAKPLIDTAVMIRHVGYEVASGEDEASS